MSDKRIFKLAPIEDDERNAVIWEREKACQNEALADGAYRLYTWLTDLSYLRSENFGKPGIIARSHADLAMELHCAEKSISNRKSVLLRLGYIWTTGHKLANSQHLLTVWHISILDPKPNIPANALVSDKFISESHPATGVNNTTHENRGKDGRFTPGSGKVYTCQRQKLAGL